MLLGYRMWAHKILTEIHSKHTVQNYRETRSTVFSIRRSIRPFSLSSSDCLPRQTSPWRVTILPSSAHASLCRTAPLPWFHRYFPFLFFIFFWILSVLRNKKIIPARNLCEELFSWVFLSVGHFNSMTNPSLLNSELLIGTSNTWYELFSM